MQLQWHKRDDHEWHVLEGIERSKPEGYGVFVIWRGADARGHPIVLYVGHGPLRQGLESCRRDPLFHGSPGLHVTWANVHAQRDIEPIASYLYQQLRPLWGEVLAPTPRNVPVNLPLSA